MALNDLIRDEEKMPDHRDKLLADSLRDSKSVAGPDAAETVTVWIRQLKAGDGEAAEKLWQRYFAKLVRLAARNLGGAKRSAADEEDVALSAFKSICMGARAGRFPRLTDRDSLWTLFMAITANKSVDLIRHENRQKRGGSGGAAHDDARGQGRTEREIQPLSEIISGEPSPETAVLVAELFKLLMRRLEQADDPDLLQIAVARMLGDSKIVIAERLDCSCRTVERKLKLIHHIWQSECE